MQAQVQIYNYQRSQQSLSNVSVCATRIYYKQNKWNSFGMPSTYLPHSLFVGKHTRIGFWFQQQTSIGEVFKNASCKCLEISKKFQKFNEQIWLYANVNKSVQDEQVQADSNEMQLFKFLLQQVLYKR
ncbi:unnamed protein product (macronuclear) [Paramecium tetraurelia]|uniref:Uncharacterized protein n=1 Tax=Paramecium tetraurelia TaxID=5888 RepID=A0BKU9_PARTE|nr:uncharacterized protein GSPATT00029797001 [Paramecium tetraurelia]CAK59166.1 unnamed protein product [Paramecium tetraurelia]|eukprot:XP_001426564.1 hypothetical protein (macronuclear) [Paramecium tetraurelia strain d4-2]